MVHYGKVKGTDFVLFCPTMHQICALDLPTMHHFGDQRYGLLPHYQYFERSEEIAYKPDRTESCLGELEKTHEINHFPSGINSLLAPSIIISRVHSRTRVFFNFEYLFLYSRQRPVQNTGWPFILLFLLHYIIFTKHN